MSQPPSDRKPEPKLVKISALARLSGVPAATIKHYLREGLITCALRTSRNMAFYDVALVPRIRAIKELQRTRFLPLRVIKETIDRAPGEGADATMTDAIARALAQAAPGEDRTRADILAAGMPAADLDGLRARGLVAPVAGGGTERYRGDDAALLGALAAARRAGFDTGMLPLAIMDAYAAAVSALVRVELGLFRHGVLPRAGADLSDLAGAAVLLSEKVVLFLRRKLLLPTLGRVLAEESPKGAPPTGTSASKRRPRGRETGRSPR